MKGLNPNFSQDFRLFANYTLISNPLIGQKESDIASISDYSSQPQREHDLHSSRIKEFQFLLSITYGIFQPYQAHSFLHTAL